MKAVILTAGFGRRMQPLTDSQHKTLIKVDGREILFRIVDGLVENNVKDIVVITGYRDKDIRCALHAEYGRTINVEYIHNEKYEITNNIYSMYLAFEGMEINSDILLIESDLVCEPEVFKKVINSPYSNVALVDKYRSGMDGTVVSISNKRINNIFLPHNQGENFDFSDKYKTLNIYKFSKSFCNNTFKGLLKYYAQTIDDNCYYELILGILIYLQKEEINSEIIENEKWAEVDDPNDLMLAEFLFSKNNKQKILEQSFGGYWAYDILDFCFIRNMYFPNASMLSQIHNSAAGLLYNYGSKQSVLNTKLSYFTKFNSDYLMCLNGASQIYPILRRYFSGSRVLIPAPTFGEYNRIFPDSSTYLDLSDENLVQFKTKLVDSEVIVIVNPNNPTGSIMRTDSIIELVKKYPEKFFLIDESFIEFSREESIIPTIEKENLKNTLVIKSLSKVLGVPGVRLGYTHTCNQKLKLEISTSIPIWNINSFAEYFLEILLKHGATYKESINKTCRDREEFANLLKSLNIVQKVFPSNSNFILIKLASHVDAEVLCDRLLNEFSIYVKTVSDKFNDGCQYLRLAVRLPEENLKLIFAMTKISL